MSAESLADADTAAAALKLTYDAMKARDRKVSLAFLARAAGIPSTGYLSDVFSGRRRLHAKYRDAVLAALKLTRAPGEYVRVLLALDELTPDAPERAALERERDGLRKLPRAKSRTLPERLSDLFFAFEVFAAFGLGGNRATRASLRDFFGASRGVELDLALAVLSDAGLIERDGDGYRLVKDQITFGAGEDGLSHVDYLRLALRDAEERVASWFDKPQEALLTSSIISVKDADFRAALPRIKDTLQRFESDLESAAADRLVRFNVQIYPLG